MKKWDQLRGTLTNDTQNGIRELQSHAVNSRWQQVRDISQQLVVGASVLCLMQSIDMQREDYETRREAEKNREDLRKASRKAARSSARSDY